MDISVVCSRLSDNTLVRAYLLLQTIDDADISVYGMVDEDGLYPFFDKGEFDFNTVAKTNRSGSVGRASDMVRFWRHLATELGETDLLYFASGWKDNVIPGLVAARSVAGDPHTVLDVYDHTPWFDQVPLVDPEGWFDTVIASNSCLADRVSGGRVYTPVDTDRFDPERYDRRGIRDDLGFGDEDVVVGFIGTPRRSKGVHHLVRAVDDGGDDLKGLLVGAGDEGYAAELRSMASDDVVFVPPVAHSEIPKYYAAIDLMVLSQEHTLKAKYQIPAKLFEAMSMGRPVVGTAIGDIPEVIGETGVTIDRVDAESVLDAIGRVRDAEIEDLGAQARRRVRERYSNEVVGKQLRSILQELDEASLHDDADVDSRTRSSEDSHQ
jgi:hypothetical protein